MTAPGTACRSASNVSRRSNAHQTGFTRGGRALSEPAARAGWYPDPGGSNGQRYWDGAGWTTQSRPTPTKHAPPRWVWAAASAVGLIALVIGVVLARVIASDDNQQRSLPTTPARVPAQPPVDTPHQAAPPAAVAPTPASTEACGPDEATALHTALNQLAPEPVTGRDWGSAPVEANYDPCADLSTILVGIRGGTGSSPVQALMFHRGNYLGTATAKAYGFTSLNTGASSNDTVVLAYRSGQSCTACDDGTVTTVRYRWDGAHVQMLDPPPP
jgi:hypothetical protein